MITKPTYWTEPRVISLLEEMLETIENETNPKTWHITMGGLCLSFKIYRQIISEWEHKYEDNRQITDSIKNIQAILETRVNEGALRGQLNFVQSIFNLKNNYGWKDVQHVDDPSKRLVNDELAEIRERLSKRTKRNIKHKK